MTAIIANTTLHSFTVTLPDGAGFQAPTRADAERAYLDAVAPELAKWAAGIERAYPDIGSRARRAAALVLGGAIQLAEPITWVPPNGFCQPAASLLARVKSRSQGPDYLVTVDPWGEIICDCSDAQPVEGEDGAPPSKLAPHMCQHILAVFLAG